MAFIQKGPCTNTPISPNPRSIVITAKDTPTVLTLQSDNNTFLEFDVLCPAFTTLFFLRPVLTDRFATGADLSASVAGDSDSFVRIDG